MRTRSTKPAEPGRAWYLVDAKGRTLGRLASLLAHYLRGKHKPEYAAHVDTGDYLVVINASRVVLSGRKEQQKTYYRHSGYPGGMKRTTVGRLRERKPEMIIYLAVKGMMPRTPLARAMLRKLKIYPGDAHPHLAQQLQPFPW